MQVESYFSKQMCLNQMITHNQNQKKTRTPDWKCSLEVKCLPALVRTWLQLIMLQNKQKKNQLLKNDQHSLSHFR